MLLPSTTSSSLGRDDPQSWGSAERLLLTLLVALIGMRLDLRFGLQAGPLLALGLGPVWLAVVRRFRWLPSIGGVLVLAAIVGWFLTASSSTGSSTRLLVERSSLLITLAGAVGGLLWARSRIGADRTAVAFGVGMVASIPLNISADPNQWRFTYSIPVIVLTLSLVSAYRGRGAVALQVGAALGLAAVGLLNDSRSNSAMLLLAAFAVVWHAADHLLRRGRGGVYLLGAWAVGCFFLVQSAVLSGAFGEAIEERTRDQIDQSGGNVLLGGRPEIAASVELLQHAPLGIGSGVLASYDAVTRAKDAMSRIGYDPNNGYVERFMFGNGIEVHSSIGDYWLWFGLPGLALAVLVVVLVFQGVRQLYDSTALTVLAAYLATRVAWDLAFSPATSGAHLLALTVALLALPRRPRSPSALGSRPVGGAPGTPG